MTKFEQLRALMDELAEIPGSEHAKLSFETDWGLSEDASTDGFKSICDRITALLPDCCWHVYESSGDWGLMVINPANDEDDELWLELRFHATEIGVRLEEYWGFTPAWWKWATKIVAELFEEAPCESAP